MQDDGQAARPAAPGRQAGWLPVLDGVRAVAVLLVLWAHVPPALPGYPAALAAARALVDPGSLGVDLFFVLSGFLITRILLCERERGQPLRWFLLRRALRILPCYYGLLALLWWRQPGAELPWCAVYLANFWFVAHDVWSPLKHTWSLCVEEHFYLLWPLCVAFLPVRAALALLLRAVLPGAVLIAVVGGLCVPADRLQHFLQFSSPVRFFSLGLGCLLAFGEARIAARPFAFAALGVCTIALGALLAPASLVELLPRYVLDCGPLVPARLWPVPSLVSTALLSTGLLLLLLARGRGLLCSWLRLGPLRGIGRISYGLYLYHLPIFDAVLYPQPSPAALLRALAFTFGAAVASYLLLERPLLRLGARFRAVPAAPRVPVPVPVPTLAAPASAPTGPAVRELVGASVGDGGWLELEPVD